MGSVDTFWHLSSFAAPALFVALAVALAGRWMPPRDAQRPGWLRQTGLNAVAGLTALAAGLWWFGVDGKMASYGALAGAVATSQWLGSRAWRS